MAESLDPERKVRINVFSFVRSKSTASDNFKNLACTTGGSYQKVLYFGQIENAIQRIVKEENIELADVEVHPTWSNAYIDMAGFGLVITVTLPVVAPTTLTQKCVINSSDNRNLSFIGKKSVPRDKDE